MFSAQETDWSIDQLNQIHQIDQIAPYCKSSSFSKPQTFCRLVPSENGWMPCTRANLSHGKRSSPSHPPHRQLGRCSAWNILQYTNYVSYCMYYTSHFCMNCRLFWKIHANMFWYWYVSFLIGRFPRFLTSSCLHFTHLETSRHLQHSPSPPQASTSRQACLL